MGINRNILECKVKYIRETYGVNWVLIETYWNVKERRASGNGCVPRINRNILECKVAYSLIACNIFAVLIETYWNVKEDVTNFLKRLRKY